MNNFDKLRSQSGPSLFASTSMRSDGHGDLRSESSSSLSDSANARRIASVLGDSVSPFPMSWTPMHREFIHRLNTFVKEMSRKPASSSSTTDSYELRDQFFEREAVIMVHQTMMHLRNLGELSQPLIQSIEKKGVALAENQKKFLFKIQLALHDAISTLSSEIAKPLDPPIIDGSPTKHRLAFSLKKKKKLGSLPEKSQELVYLEKVQELWKNVVSFRNDQEAMAKLPVHRWINQTMLSLSKHQSQEIPIVFEGIWTSVPTTKKVDYLLWPPKLWKSYAWSELTRSFFSDSRCLFQRESLTLEGPIPVSVLERFRIGGVDKVKLDPKLFFQRTIGMINKWLDSSYTGALQKSQEIVAELFALENDPVTYDETRIAQEELSQILEGKEPTMEHLKEIFENKDTVEDCINEMVFLRRADRLARKHVAVSLLSATTINASVGLFSVRSKYFSELFSRAHDESCKHLYVSRQDHDYSTYLSMKLPEEHTSLCRVTQTTKYHLHEYPSNGPYGEPIASFLVHWAVGIPTANIGYARQYGLKITDLKIVSPNVEDHQVIPFLFEQAQHRYIRDKLTLPCDPFEIVRLTPHELSEASSSTA